jgi:hypothetical protein
MRLRRAGTLMRRDDSTRIPTRVRVACTERTAVVGARERTLRRGAVRRVRATTKCEACDAKCAREISFLLVDIDIERATRRVHPSL